MIDSFGRNIDYMRVSLTDKCNLNCIYCRSDCDKSYLDTMSADEIIRIIRTEETDYMKETCPPHVDLLQKDIDLEKYELLITVSPTYYHKSPIPCLSFFPKVLHLGIGCKKGLTDMKSVLTDLYISAPFSTGST